MKEQKIYLLLTDTGTLFTRMIKMYTKRKFNHASIAFDEDLSDVYSFGRKVAHNPFIGGFVKENINEGLFKHANCAVYSFTVTETQVNKMKHFIQSIEAKKEFYRYNLLGLFAIMLNMKFHRDNAFFCSQFVGTVLTQGENIYFDKPLSLITPYDLQSLPKIHLEYEGKLAAYNSYNLNKQFIGEMVATA